MLVSLLFTIQCFRFFIHNYDVGNIYIYQFHLIKLLDR